MISDFPRISGRLNRPPDGRLGSKLDFSGSMFMIMFAERKVKVSRNSLKCHVFKSLSNFSVLFTQAGFSIKAKRT